MPEPTTKRTSRSSRAAERGAQPTRSRQSRSSRVIAVSKSGTPITEELAEQLAKEAEAGYDLSHARPVGRKSLSGGGRSSRLNVRTTVDLYEKALAKAKREGKTVSQLAREALEKYV